MKWIRISLPLLVSGLCVLTSYSRSRAASENNSLGAPQLIFDGSKAINVDTGHAAPAVMDCNGDGKKDLLAGQFEGGKVRVYVNRGTNEKPVFKGFQYMKAGGQVATVPYG